jgi:IclR family acetate operon transcriptional repressor
MERRSDIRNAAANAPSVTSVERAFALIEALVARGVDVSLGDLAADAGLPKPTAHRILQTLSRGGYVDSNGAGGYLPGPRLLVLAGGLLDTSGYARYARPALAELERQTPETIHFAVLIGDEAVYVEKLEGRQPYRMASRIGMPLALHCTAIGKVILAYLPENAGLRRAALAGQLERRTDRTLVESAELERELVAIRSQGYALDDEENEAGVRCVGAPVFGGAGRVVGGISVSAPALQFSREDATSLAPIVIEAAQGVSRAIGAPPAEWLVRPPATTQDAGPS